MKITRAIFGSVFLLLAIDSAHAIAPLADLRAAEDSFNLLPAWRGEDNVPIRPYLLTQAFSGARTLSIRRGPWKFLDHRGSGGNAYDKGERESYSASPCPRRGHRPGPTLQPRHRPRRNQEPPRRAPRNREGTQSPARRIEVQRP